MLTVTMDDNNNNNNNNNNKEDDQTRSTSRRAAKTCAVNAVALYPPQEPPATFAGLMFQALASPGSGRLVEVTTLELNVDLQAGMDLSAEVYIYHGDYNTLLRNGQQEDAWERVASSPLFLFPNHDNKSKGGRRAILPSYNFKPFLLSQQEATSIYIKMTGPWLNNAIHASVKSDQQLPPSMEENADTLEDATDEGWSTLSDDILILPGTAVEDTSFGKDFALAPSALMPIFAGRVHLRTDSGDCPVPPPTISDFLIVTSEHIVTEDLLASISETVRITVESVVRVDSDLVLYQNDYGLQQAEVTSYEIAFTGSCPWKRCAAIETKIAWTHKDSLRVDDFLYQLYKYTDSVTEEIQYTMEQGQKVQYIGKVATKVEYQFNLSFANPTALTDPSQQDYFAQFTKRFINSNVPDGTIDVLSMVWDKQEFVNDDIENEMSPNSTVTASESIFQHDDDKDNTANGERRTAQDFRELQVTGRFLGTRYNGMSKDDFAHQIHTLYNIEDKTSTLLQDYIEEMTFSVKFPGPMDEFERHRFFDDLISVQGTVKVDLSAIDKPAPTSNSGDGNGGLAGFLNRSFDKMSDWEPRAWILIGVFLSLTLLGCATYFIVRCVREELESYERKQERMADKEYARHDKRLESIRAEHAQQMEDTGASSGYTSDAELSSMHDSYAHDDQEDYDQDTKDQLYIEEEDQLDDDKSHCSERSHRSIKGVWDAAVNRISTIRKTMLQEFDDGGSSSEFDEDDDIEDDKSFYEDHEEQREHARAPRGTRSQSYGPALGQFLDQEEGRSSHSVRSRTHISSSQSISGRSQHSVRSNARSLPGDYDLGRSDRSARSNARSLPGDFGFDNSSNHSRSMPIRTSSGDTLRGYYTRPPPKAYIPDHLSLSGHSCSRSLSGSISGDSLGSGSVGSSHSKIAVGSSHSRAAPQRSISAHSGHSTSSRASKHSTRERGMANGDSRSLSGRSAHSRRSQQRATSSGDGGAGGSGALSSLTPVGHAMQKNTEYYDE